MVNECNIYEDSEYKFLDFNSLINTIFISFLDDTDIFERDFPLSITSRVMKSYLKHSTLVEILKTYDKVNTSKVNAILIPKDLRFKSNRVLSNDDDFIKLVLKTIDSSKRNIPLLIKRVDSTFNDIPTFIATGEGKDFLASVNSDKEKLRSKVNTFEQFKKFAKKEKLIYILDKLIDKIEFKRLFMS